MSALKKKPLMDTNWGLEDLAPIVEVESWSDKAYALDVAIEQGIPTPMNYPKVGLYDVTNY